MRLLVAWLLIAPALVSADESRRLQDSTLERRVFRHILVGRIVYPSERLTWVFYRGGDRARIEVFCQEGDRSPTKGIRLDGKEFDETYWLAPSVARYAGTRTGAKAATYELRLEDGPKGEKSRCGSAPPAVTLVCSMAKIDVRPAGAVLIPGSGDNPEAMSPARWKPATQQKVTGLRCQATNADLPLFGLLADHPAFFAPATESSPGIEWADENSDMAVQEGAYRRLSSAPPPLP